MDIKPFKNRSVDLTKKVDVYRCLNRKGHVYSIRQNGYVVGHTENICLSDANFIVNYSGKMRAQKKMSRNVHAYIRAFIKMDYVETLTTPITYNPFKSINFHIKNSNAAVSNSPAVVINEKGVFI